MIETNRIYNGDCLEIMKSWPDASVDMIFTDPPYGNKNLDGDLASSRVGVKGGRQKAAVAIKNDSVEDTARVLRGLFIEAARILKPTGVICCMTGGGGPGISFAHFMIEMDAHLSFFQAIIWDKSARGNGMGWRYRRNYEFVLVGFKKGGKLAWADDSVAVPNIVQTPPVANEDHPTQKPVDLMASFIRWHTQPGDIVVDPFCGSGSTLIAAERMGRKWIGVELDEAFYPVARERMDAELSQGKLL